MYFCTYVPSVLLNIEKQLLVEGLGDRYCGLFQNVSYLYKISQIFKRGIVHESMHSVFNCCASKINF